MLKNRDFTLYGKKFHLNDTYHIDKYCSRYELMGWNELSERWERVFFCNTKKEALEQLKADKWLYF